MNETGIHSDRGEQGSALLAVLVVTLLITLLLALIFSIYTINVKRAEQHTHAIQAQYLAEAGIYKVLAKYEPKRLVDEQTIAIPLFDADTAFVSANPFGAYIKLESRVSVNGLQENVSVLAGQHPGSSFQYSISLGDIRSELSIAGSAVIKGDLKVGPLGIAQKSFKGKRFTGSVEGDIRKEKENLLPVFNSSFTERSVALFNKLLKRGAPQKPASFAVFGARDSLKENDGPVTQFNKGDCTLDAEKIESFRLNKGSKIICTGTIKIEEEIKLPALCRLIAGKGIYINGKVEGGQLLFYTPSEIWIGEGSRLSGQFLAGNRVMITKDAYVRYPSVVWVQHPEFNQQKVIVVKDKARFDGTIIYNAKIPEESSKLLNRVLIGRGTKVRGAIYNTHQTEFHGQLLGSLFTHQFYFYESPTTYINWMKDGHIDLTGRPDNYLLPIGFSNGGKFDIVYWNQSGPNYGRRPNEIF